MLGFDREHFRRIPKAELHLHLEGSLSPNTVWELAQRQGQPFGLASPAACRQLYQFSDFMGFIQAIKTASQLLRDPSDYALAVRSLARRLQSQGVVYAEVFLSIGILLWRGVPIEPYWEEVESAREAAEEETGVRIRWIFDAVRQFGVEHVDRVVTWAARHSGSPAALGIGIGGDEAGGPASWFAASFARAKDAGLRLTAHAGETCGAGSIWAAIAMGAERIGHGLRAFEDPALVEALAVSGIPLDICPTSNLRTGAWKLGHLYPAHRYRKAGVRLTISTDDPGIFGCDLLEEYDFLAHSGGFSGNELEALARESFKCSFLSEAECRTMASLPLLSAPDAGRDRGVGVE